MKTHLALYISKYSHVDSYILLLSILTSAMYADVESYPRWSGTCVLNGCWWRSSYPGFEYSRSLGMNSQSVSSRTSRGMTLLKGNMPIGWYFKHIYLVQWGLDTKKGGLECNLLNTLEEENNGSSNIALYWYTFTLDYNILWVINMIYKVKQYFISRQF